MAVLHVKTPNGTQKNIDIDKIFTTAGGTINGPITTSVVDFIKRNSNGDHLTIIGGTAYGDSASLVLGGGDSSYDGRCVLRAKSPNGDSSLSCYSTGSLTWKGWEILQVGIIQAFAGSNTPTGWLLCDGSAISRTTYDKLFSIIGTRYGAGNGSTTFNLPNLTDKFIQGSGTVGTVKAAGLPNISGSMVDNFMGQGLSTTGPFSHTETIPTHFPTQSTGNSVYWPTVSFDASKSNSIYGASTTVQPPALTMRYIIKY